MNNKAEVRFFQTDRKQWPTRLLNMELHARLAVPTRAVTIVTHLANVDEWERQLKDTQVKVSTPFRVKGKPLEGLILVDHLDAQALVEMHKLVIKEGAEFSVIDLRSLSGIKR
jgi:hypothetical protein